ncbi:aspartate/glutamate racemase family protein [Rhizobium mayense]|uniref:Aspartate/glutamate racemase family protein n=1 Tax=Rhizobium mayense TaxID=1312184 RepID=A0ABT7K5X6_9HYPH|nr:aspartate/glutamate racemase family protein [Rhizobium mayense]MDL2403353.1 aspartate/glutamate racemase family protein [Rhizobium mayense]
MTRILFLSPADIDLPEKVIPAGAADPDTEIIHRRVAYVSCPPIGAHDWTLADLAVIAAGQHAQADGFDAVCLADFGDYGANALRSLLDIPVVTAGRAALLHALTLGTRFSVVSTERDYVRIKKIVHEYALDAQCAGIHLLTPKTDMVALTADAEVLVLAGEARNAKFDRVNVSIIDPLPLAVKLAESLVGLGLTHSRRAYPAPQTRKATLIKAIGSCRTVSLGQPVCNVNYEDDAFRDDRPK